MRGQGRTDCIAPNHTDMRHSDPQRESLVRKTKRHHELKILECCRSCRAINSSPRGHVVAGPRSASAVHAHGSASLLNDGAISLSADSRSLHSVSCVLEWPALIGEEVGKGGEQSRDVAARSMSSLNGFSRS